MKHVYQIMFFWDRFDYNLDDYVREMSEGPLYATREAAEKHLAWYKEKDPCGRCEICEVAVHDDFEPKNRK